MKSTGIVRKLDNVGRIVISTEVRQILNIKFRDPIAFYEDGNTIIMKKYNPGCIFCGQINDTIEFKGKCICKECLDDLKNIG